MTFIEKLEIIDRIDRLIKRKGTGTAKELAARLGISRSTVFAIFSSMRTMGAIIEYDEVKTTYYYVVEKHLYIGFIDPNKIKGGKSECIFPSPDFSDWSS